MPIDFHLAKNSQMYAARQANGTWKTLINTIVDVQGRTVADVGCGGGIYARALADMGASHVTCIDSSQVMLTDAQNNLAAYKKISYLLGDAVQTHADEQQFDLVLERALVHHLQAADLPACFAEARRLLRPGCTLIVQDRTPEDCLLPGSQTHIRGYFFERYPRLAEQEVARRHETMTIKNALQQAGFRKLEKRQLWETRMYYNNLATLAEDLQSRRGRSILHELSDDELQDLVEYIHRRLGEGTQSIIEQDRWTIWSALR